MPIELKYNIDAPDWEPFLRPAARAIDRWASANLQPRIDEFGKYYDVTIHGNPKADLKRHWVLRPATLHLGAHKVLQNAGYYRAGWDYELDVIWDAVSSTKPLHDFAEFGDSCFDLMIQAAWFRGEVLFP